MGILPPDKIISIVRALVTSQAQILRVLIEIGLLITGFCVCLLHYDKSDKYVDDRAASFEKVTFLGGC